MRFLRYATAIFLFQTLAWARLDLQSAEDSEEEELEPCTTKSPANHFFDIRPIQVPPVDRVNPNPDIKATSWHAKGYDYGADFNINFCGPVVEVLDDVEGIDSFRYHTVGAYYEKDGKRYSIGENNTELVFRGKKMVLEYRDGSPCGTNTTNEDPFDGGEPMPTDSRRKMTILSLLCDRDQISPKAAVSFVGASDDECAYFFEVRTPAACQTLNVQTQAIGPSGVFGVIFIVAFLVYLLGGIVYQRAVLNQRGWRQLPNYPFWSGIGGFAKDMIVILFSSCSRCFSRRSGYRRFGANGWPAGGMYNRSEDENRLIDQFDEEWEE